MSDILKEADFVAGQGRSRDYGHPHPNHKRIADIWNVQLGPKLTTPIEPREVALMMIGLKLAREVNSPKRDNLVDAAGYVKCVDMIDEYEADKNSPVAQTMPTGPSEQIEITPLVPVVESSFHGVE